MIVIAEAVQQVASLGVFVEESAAEMLEKLPEQQLRTLLDKIRANKPLILTEKEIKDLLIKPPRELTAKSAKPPKSVQEWANALNNRYSFIKDVLINKVDVKSAVSISTAATSNGSVTIIGLVRNIEKNNDKLQLEVDDPTGSMNVELPALLGERLETDDVVAFSGVVNSGGMRADILVWPDVPQRAPQTGFGTVAFARGLDLSKEVPASLKTADYILLSNCTGTERAVLSGHVVSVAEHSCIAENKKQCIAPPCCLEIGGLNILILNGKNPLVTLRRRYALIGTDETRPRGDFLIDPVPDIIFADVPAPIDYKGVTVIGNGIVNLANREVKQL